MSTQLENVTTETCQDWMLNGAIPEADTEISGIGAILAFLLSAYITFAIVLISYLLGSIDTSLLRPVDLYVHRLPSQRRTSISWHKALHQCVLLLSDQQIVTGIAVYCDHAGLDVKLRPSVGTHDARRVLSEETWSARLAHRWNASSSHPSLSGTGTDQFEPMGYPVDAGQ
ncbi:hypothetical protein D6D19_01698 [Aureobasidium pullulans]|uniref:Uncharacterized protein n=1 Tax=Aureobasidium pullulans TaxID=5580 RepID=A0A4S8V613_AURPU|nr:hypothetical protein D6D28_09533 [Aureobasidium pullulans]THW06338.1 hypothetical protein D6D26_01607 [Aureobasidium pullulans]THW78787.1 hypothetical protein D6D19_01698 [Aureobasidium pullulans]THY30793.1 hypothetical protein D6D00_02717 [Aureobasidium pullulans]